MQHYKKKKYTLRILTIFITLFLLVLVVVLSLALNNDDITEGGGEPISSQSGSQASDESSSMLVSEAESITPSSNSSIAASQKDTSSVISSKASNESSSDTDEASSLHEDSSSTAESENTDTTDNTALPLGSLSDWNLILLNPFEGNSISEELQFEKTKFDTQYVDSRAANAYQDMYNSAKKDGVTLYLRSGYRSMKTQSVNYNANVQRLLKQGVTKDEAIRQTNLYYTVPGHSEHHSGLAFDIITPEYHRDIYTLNEKFAQTKAYTWLRENCAEYGFILRYPKEKYNITTINFEPWHYRYVGVEHAKYITENNLCLEEYVELLKQAGR